MRTCLAGWAVVTLAIACGPKKGPDSGGGGSGGGGGGGGGAGADAGGGTSSGSDAESGGGAATPLTRAECEDMIDHVLAIGMEAQRKNKPEEYVPTAEQLAKIRAKFVDEQMEPCLAWPRPVWECTMAATTPEALYTCAEGGGS